MSVFYIPSDLATVPFDFDVPLFHLTVQLTPENYNSFTGKPDLLNNIRLRFFTGVPSSYPRFDPKSWPYNLIAPPEHNLIVPINNPQFQDFDTLTDLRAIELKCRAEKYEKVYLFYSGGIDSTIMLCSLLKNWNSAELSKLVVVLNQNSIDEYPLMFREYILDKLSTVSTDDFYSGKYIFDNGSIYTSSACADCIFGYQEMPDFDEKFPNVYLKPWRKNKDIDQPKLYAVDTNYNMHYQQAPVTPWAK